MQVESALEESALEDSMTLNGIVSAMTRVQFSAHGDELALLQPVDRIFRVDRMSLGSPEDFARNPKYAFNGEGSSDCEESFKPTMAFERHMCRSCSRFGRVFKGKSERQRHVWPIRDRGGSGSGGRIGSGEGRF